MNSGLTKAVGAWIVLATNAIPARAQVTSGTVTGTVKDAQGAHR